MASFSSSAAAADSGGDTDQNKDGLTSPSSPSGLDEETTNLIVENLMQTGLQTILRVTIYRSQ